MILRKLRGFFSRSESVKPDRRSHQGWSDQQPDWPGSGDGRSQFPTPWEAVDLVETSLQNLTVIQLQISRALGAEFRSAGLGHQARDLLSVGLQVLSLDDSEMAPRKGTFGRLSHLLIMHLPELPELANVYPFNEQIFYLADDLQYSGDADLVRQGRNLAAVLKSVADQGLEVANSVPPPSRSGNLSQAVEGHT